MTDFEKLFDKVFLDLTKGCVPKVDDNYPNIVFYCMDGYIMMYYDSKTNYFWFSHREIWENLELMLGLNYQEMKELLNGTLERTSNLKDVTPACFSFNGNKMLERTYNLKDVTPTKRFFCSRC